MGQKCHEDPIVLHIMQAPLSEQRRFFVQWGYGDVGLLMLMSSCDGRCFFCAQPNVTNAPAELVTENRQIQRWLDTHPPSKILIGGTEPMSHHLLFPSLELLQKKGVKEVELMTSGFRITSKKVASRLFSCGVKRICAPLYSANSQVHDQIVGVPGNWSQVIFGLKMASEVGIEVSIHTLALRKNMLELKALSSFVLSLFRSRLVVAPLREKESLFVYGAEAPELSILSPILQSLNISLSGFPLCFLPDTPREGPAIIRLYFQGQERIKPKDVCLNCYKESSCLGIVPSYVRTFGTNSLSPFE